jgi:hypothetical protein
VVPSIATERRALTPPRPVPVVSARQRSGRSPFNMFSAFFRRVKSYKVATGVNDDGARNSPGYDVGVVEEDKIEVYVF